ncbi:MAG: beta-ketoacyl-ACP synthase II [Gammaproteobacteria bacterium]
MANRRVVITGLGIVSPLGNDVEQVWKNILAGQSGVGPITTFDVSEFSTRIAAAVDEATFDITEFLPNKEARKFDGFILYGIYAAAKAMIDSGLVVTEENGGRMGVAVGSGIGGAGVLASIWETLDKASPRKISPFSIPGSIINMVAGKISMMYGLRGPNISVVTACTTGTHNIGAAYRMIQYGDADVMLAGGAEKAITPLGLGGFCAARALSTRNDDPTHASRPFDKDRDGFVMGDGAGIVVLELLEHAQARGARIYAEVVGFGMSADAYHMTAPSGVGAIECMKNALHDAKMKPENIHYINAHGTSTLMGDSMESQSIEKLFGEHAFKLAMSSTKSMTGHLLGAAGAIETLFTALAIRDQIAPPTINLVEPSEDCRLNYVPNKPQQMRIEAAMNNNFGFGGTNGTLILKEFKS